MNQDWNKILLAVKKIGGQKELATRLGIPDSTVRNWFSRKSIPLELAPLVIKALSNEISMDDIDAEFMHEIRELGQTYTLIKSKEIPFIRYEHLKNIKQAINDSTNTIPIGSPLSNIISSDAFALHAFDDSMEPDIKSGDIIIIDPKIEPKPRDIILASAKNNKLFLIGKYRVNQYMDDSLDITIIPSNNFYPLIDINANNPGNIIGPVLEIRRTIKNIA